MAQANLPAPIEDTKYDIPEMRALTAIQQRFVIAVAEGSNRNSTACLVAAGYTGADPKRQAHRYIHNPKVQAAIRALIPARWHEMGPQAIQRIFDIAMDPQHKDSLKACLAIKDYIAPLVAETKVTHELGARSAETAQLMIRQLAGQAGLNNAALMKAAEVIKSKAPAVIEADYTEVDMSDLEDIL